MLRPFNFWPLIKASPCVPQSRFNGNRPSDFENHFSSHSEKSIQRSQSTLRVGETGGNLGDRKCIHKEKQFILISDSLTNLSINLPKELLIMCRIGGLEPIPEYTWWETGRPDCQSITRRQNNLFTFTLTAYLESSFYVTRTHTDTWRTYKLHMESLGDLNPECACCAVTVLSLEPP